MSRPLVSVILPVFNAERFVAEALRSIAGQAYEPLEVIVVDDGSTDDTMSIVHETMIGVRCLHQANRGPAAARNAGLAESHGDLIAFLDADDTWPLGKLDLQVSHLNGDTSIEIVLGRIQYEALDGRSLEGIRFDGPDSTLTNVNLGCGVFRRTIFDRVGPFDESLRFSEDHDWFLRARELGVRLRVLDEVTLCYRLHSGNMTRGKSTQEMSVTSVLKRSLDRRRARAGIARALEGWAVYKEVSGVDR